MRLLEPTGTGPLFFFLSRAAVCGLVPWVAVACLRVMERCSKQVRCAVNKKRNVFTQGWLAGASISGAPGGRAARDSKGVVGSSSVMSSKLILLAFHPPSASRTALTRPNAGWPLSS